MPVQNATNIPPATAVNMTWTRSQKQQIRQLFGLSGSAKRVTKTFARKLGFESLESLRQTSWGVIRGDAPTLARMTTVTGLDLDQRASALAANADLRERVQQRVRDSMNRLPMRVDVTSMLERRLDHAGTGGTRLQATLVVKMDITIKSGSGREHTDVDVVRTFDSTIFGDEGELQEQGDRLAHEMRDVELARSPVVDVKLKDWWLDSVTEVVTGQARSLTSVRMRSASFMRIDGVAVNGYDTGRGECVPDVLEALYGDPKYGLAKWFKNGRAKLWDAFAKAYHETAKGDWDYKPNYNPKKGGVLSLVLHEGFCKPSHISQYVCDMGSNVIARWVDPANRKYNRPILTYRLFNNHMHLDLESARSIANATSGAAITYTFRSLLAAEHGAQGRGDDMATAFDPTNIVEVDEETGGLAHMAAYAREHQTWPSGSSIHLYDNRVVKYKADGVQYVFGQQLALVGQAYERMGWEHKGGEAIPSLVWQTVLNVFGRPGMVRGKPNPEAREVLLAEGLKAHAQCGTVVERHPAGRYDVFDISKSHGAALHTPLEHWYVNGPHDHIERFRPRPPWPGSTT
mgnify:CR=1 FL=1